MAAARPSLKVSTRTEFGSRTSRRLRRSGMVPGIVYTAGQDARHLQADAHTVSLFLGEGHTLFDLEIEGEQSVPVVVKEEQRHPVRGELVHIDFHEVDLKVAIQADVQIELVGGDDAPGVKEGGILEFVTDEITVEALPEAVPDQIELDVSAMEIGDTLQLSVVTAPEGVKFMADHPDEVTIATLNPPPVIEEPETEVEEETTVIGEEADEVEGADGDDAGDDSGDSGDSGDDEG